MRDQVCWMVTSAFPSVPYPFVSFTSFHSILQSTITRSCNTILYIAYCSVFIYSVRNTQGVWNLFWKNSLQAIYKEGKVKMYNFIAPEISEIPCLMSNKNNRWKSRHCVLLCALLNNYDLTRKIKNYNFAIEFQKRFSPVTLIQLILDIDTHKMINPLVGQM